MEDTNSLIEQRKANLKSLEAKGIFPFKNKFSDLDPSGQVREPQKCNDVRERFLKWKANPNDPDALPEHATVFVAGRITAHRDMGKSMFIDVRDQSGRIQCYAQKNMLGDEQFKIFTHLDLADFVGIKGTLFFTKTGEPSIKIGDVEAAPSQPSGDGASPPPPPAFVILAKALRPPPAKWHGLEDTEIRYRQRYLDLIANPDVKDVMLKRSAIVHEIRNFFHDRNYVEVETPVMQAIPGGAAAAPFITKHNALGCEFYLRIALELYHKRLLVGGIDKLFEIGKNFRNEGLSRRHNPEFTMLEAYCAFGDYATMMGIVEEMIVHIAKTVRKNETDPLRIEQPRVSQLVTQLSSFLNSVKEMELNGIPYDTIRRSWSEWIQSACEEIRNCLGQIGSKPYFEIAMHAKAVLEQLVRNFFENEASKAFVNSSPTIMRHLHSFVKGIIRESLEELESLSTPRIVDLAPPWKKYKYKDLVREKVRAKTNDQIIDWFQLSAQERRQIANDKLKIPERYALG